MISSSNVAPWFISVTAATLIFSTGCGFVQAAPVPAEPSSQGNVMVLLRDPQARLVEVSSIPRKRMSHLKKYQFTSDWFSNDIPVWATLLETYVGKPDVTYLEVGVWEGRSLFWMVDRVLTDKSSRAIAIEPFVKDNLLNNIEASGAKDRITLVKGFSGIEMRKMDLESIDIVYIDGAHTADAVLEDMVLAWRLLKPGGLMIMDDYMWDGNADTPDERPLTTELKPRQGVDTFVSAYRSFIEVVHKDYQFVLRKRPAACGNLSKVHCATLGPYDYNWVERRLIRGNRAVELSSQEQDLIERIIGGKSGDGLTIALPKTVYESRELKGLLARLDLDLQPVQVP